MTTLLVTNDDGVDSPALIPLIRALEQIEIVRCVNTLVPDRERSWVSKSLSRFEDITVLERKAHDHSSNPDPKSADPTRHEPRIMTATGTPADCTNLGVHRVFDQKPDLVVSGINVGLNHGLAFLMSSGTVGAAAEGVIAGLPAIAFSLGVQGGHGSFADYARSAAGAELWQKSAAVAADIVSSVLTHGLPPAVDLLNVNFPREVSLETPRVITEVARVGYDALFAASDGAQYRFDYQGLCRRQPNETKSDLVTLREGMISITPLRLPHAAPIDPELREALLSVRTRT